MRHFCTKTRNRIGDKKRAGSFRKTYGDFFTYPENVEQIPNNMFEGCSVLKRVFLSEQLNEIGNRAFFGCRFLDLLIIPDSVSKIGQDAFIGTNRQFIIQCSFGSYAEEYARKNRIKYQLV